MEQIVRKASEKLRSLIQDILIYQKEKAMICYHLILILILSIVVANQLQVIYMYQNTQQLLNSNLDYDKFRAMNVSKQAIYQAVNKKEFISYLTYQMMSNNYSMLKKEQLEDSSVWKELKEAKRSEVFCELRDYYTMIFSDLRYFPVPTQLNGEAYVSFENSWSEPRTFGGKRTHEGTDIMASKNIRGYYPVVSTTDGVIEKMGWLSQGGYRIGIRAPHGGYFYYAHLNTYAPQLSEGDVIKAGQLLGFMGDSGYGVEGTTGQFDVHLHFGIYINSKEGEMSVNPYWILKYLNDYKLSAYYGD